MRTLKKITMTTLAALLLCGCVPYKKEIQVTATGTTEQAQYIAGLQQQISALQDQIKSKDDQLSKIAGNSVAINAGLEKIDDQQLGKPVVTAENELIEKTAGDPKPEDRAAALERANALLQKDVEKAKKLYADAGAQIDLLNGQISERDGRINTLNGEITTLKSKADAAEKEAGLKIAGTIRDYEQKLQDLRDEQTKKERRLWVNTLRYTGAALILGGIVILAISKMMAWIQGCILTIGGVLIIVAGQGLDQLTQQWWWPYLCGTGVVLVVVGAGWYIIHLYSTQRKQIKLSSAVNDLRTEADTGVAEAQKTWEQLQGHLTYRLGEDAVKQLSAEWQKLGLDSKK